MSHRDKGLTLFELVIAMAVFSLVAVMGLQSLSGMLRNRDHLARIADQTSDLGQGLSMLRHDLNAVVPMLFFPPGQGAPRSAIEAVPAGFAASLGGQPEFGGTASHRVVWRHDAAAGTLSRQVWPALNPLRPTALTPEVVVMRGVTGLRFRSHWLGIGWVDGWDDPNAAFSIPAGDTDTSGAAPEVYSDTLPFAVELILDTSAFGPVPLIETLK